MNKQITIKDLIASVRPLARPCPWCGEDPGMARQVRGWFIVGCERDDCFICPQVSAPTIGEAWQRWNARAPQATNGSGSSNNLKAWEK